MSLKPIKKTDLEKWWVAKRDRKPARRSEREYILVASEDGKSSTYYFAALDPDTQGNPTTFGIIPKGVGCNTQSLVKYVKKHQAEWLAKVQEDVAIEGFNQVWLVFDLDGFPVGKFDNAIRSAESQTNGYHVAWSNECFELWYLLHFKDQITGMQRDDIYRELTGYLKLGKNYTEFKGEAGKDIHVKMAKSLKQNVAVKRARKLHNEMIQARLAPHEANPCTLVYKLIEVLFPDRRI